MTKIKLELRVFKDFDDFPDFLKHVNKQKSIQNLLIDARGLSCINQKWLDCMIGDLKISKNLKDIELDLRYCSTVDDSCIQSISSCL
mmetsp:Transcript_24424/g.21616  ORF Transcript_24424/g.21616 Transcript_24424/m.21616 type:complete len:87 (-) Transcript_24424:122-382(-)